MKRVVNVRTQEQWDKVTEILGYEWNVWKWTDVKEKSCIGLSDNVCCSINYTKEKKTEVISFKEFMKEYAPSKEYKLIITPTNKTIIIDKETGKKGMARLHPDDEYNSMEGIKLAWERLNGVEFKKEEVKKLMLSEPEFKKCKITKFYLKQWADEWCSKINEKYNINTEFNNSIGNDTIIGDVVGKGDIDGCDFYVVNYMNSNYVFYCDEIEEYEPKLYDSFGEELKEGDRFVLIDLEYNKNCTSDFSYVKLDGEELYSNGIRIHHNSKYNNGKPKNRWQVIKIK